MSFSSFLNKLAKQPPTYERKKEYKFGKTLGAGTYGVVQQADGPNGSVAIKVISKKNVKGHEHMVYDEMNLLKRLHHPHIVRFEEWFESSRNFYIVTELATGGELFERICECGRFTEHDAVPVVKEILEAVAYLHGMEIVHRDLKPENLLYKTPEQESNLILADFGIAKALQSKDQALTSMAGSYGYAAPEILLQTGHSKPADMWSFGVITYTLLCGYSPFRSEDRDGLIEETVRARVVFHERYWKDISQDAKNFIKSLLQSDPTYRPTATEALNHIWLTGKTANTTTDLLPAVKEGFNARRKLKHAIDAVRLANRLKALTITNYSSDEEEQKSGTTLRHTSHGSSGSEKRLSPSNSGSAFLEVVRAARLKAEEDAALAAKTV